MDFSKQGDRSKETQKRKDLGFGNKFKAQRSGFEFERRDSRRERSFRQKPQAGGGNGANKADPDEGQANKSARGMPWHQEPMKDVISCEKLRGAANKH